MVTGWMRGAYPARSACRGDVPVATCTRREGVEQATQPSHSTEEAQMVDASSTLGHGWQQHASQPGGC
eukprot:3941489-Pleurochrysis_carterae.AAC.1